MAVPAFGCVHAYVLLSDCAVKKVQELSAAKCVCFFLSLKCYPFIQIFFHCVKAFGLVSVCHIYDHSDYCKWSLPESEC